MLIKAEKAMLVIHSDNSRRERAHLVKIQNYLRKPPKIIHYHSKLEVIKAMPLEIILVDSRHTIQDLAH